VSVVALSGDVAAEDSPDSGAELAMPLDRPAVRPADQELARLTELVNAAEKVTVFCGRGVAGAHAEVMAFAERVKAPVGHALRGKEHIQYDNPYDVGMSGLLGYGAAYEAMHECDPPHSAARVGSALAPALGQPRWHRRSAAGSNCARGTCSSQ
jgi:pyruvate dehydrogenase (quinone)